jgi:hypothetical protein
LTICHFSDIFFAAELAKIYLKRKWEMPKEWQWGTIDEALKVHVLALADTSPKKVAPAANVHGNTPQNELSPLCGALQLYNAGKVTDLYLCGGEEYRNNPEGPVAYSGFSKWKWWLAANGVAEDKIHEIERPQPSHTGTEAQRFVRKAKEEGWKHAFVVAPPFQITRALVNNITFIIRYNVDLKVYAAPGPAEPWHEHALHSQGVQTLMRIDSVIGEWKRLNTWYDNELDLVSAEEVLNYLERRDNS